MQHYRIIDTETTGLSNPKACEVAWICIDENLNALDSKVFRVNPGAPIEPGASNIHGIYDEDVLHCPAIEEVMHGFPSKLCFIGHNVPFDQRVLGSTISWNSELCTLALARRWVKDTANHKLVTLKEHFQLSDQKSHSALGDCQTVLELLYVLCELSGRNLKGLIELESKPKVLVKMPFGQHKGKLMKDLPVGYRQWLLTLPDLHKDILYTLKTLRLV